jgi:hypothetical protein
MKSWKGNKLETPPATFRGLDELWTPLPKKNSQGFIALVENFKTLKRWKAIQFGIMYGISMLSINQNVGKVHVRKFNIFHLGWATLDLVLVV